MTEETITDFRNTLNNTTLVKEFPSQYGEINISFSQGKIKDVKVSPVFRSAEQVNYATISASGILNGEPVKFSNGS